MEEGLSAWLFGCATVSLIRTTPVRYLKESVMSRNFPATLWSR